MRYSRKHSVSSSFKADSRGSSPGLPEDYLGECNIPERAVKWIPCLVSAGPHTPYIRHFPFLLLSLRIFSHPLFWNSFRTPSCEQVVTLLVHTRLRKNTTGSNVFEQKCCHSAYEDRIKQSLSSSLGVADGQQSQYLLVFVCSSPSDKLTYFEEAASFFKASEGAKKPFNCGLAAPNLSA